MIYYVENSEKFSCLPRPNILMFTFREVCLIISLTLKGIPLETMLNFNRLKALTEDTDVIVKALEKSKSGLMEVRVNGMFMYLKSILNLEVQCYVYILCGGKPYSANVYAWDESGVQHTCLA